MTKSKKYILAIGTAATVVAPLATVVACGSNEGEGGTSSTIIKDLVNGHVVQADHSFNLSKTNFPTLKAAADAVGINKTKLSAITPSILHKISTKHTKGIDAEIIQTVETLRQVLQDWSFSNNEDASKMGQLNEWIQNAGLSTFASTRASRGPVKSDSSKGAIGYYRKDLIDIPKLLGGIGYDYKNAKLGAGTIRTIQDYNSYAAVKKGQRFFDLNIATGNAYSTSPGAAGAFTIFRGKQTGKDTYAANNQGKIVFSETKGSQYDLYKGLDIKVGNGTTDLSAGRTVESLKNAIKTNTNADTLTFSTSAANSVNYAIAQNTKVTDSGKKFEAKDLFYGFIRSIFGSKTFRQEGKIGSSDFTSSIPKMTASELTDFNAQFDTIKAAEALDNPNLYLLNLYGVNLAATVVANKATTDNSKFIIKFKHGKLSPTSAVMLQDNTLFNPFPNSEVTANDLSATSLKVISYGKPHLGGVSAVDPSGIYSLAPFLYTAYSSTPGEHVTLSKNTFYADTAWANDTKTLNVLNTTNLATGGTAEAKQLSRANGFKDAVHTGEYILSSDVKSSPTMMRDMSAWKVTTSLTESGTSANSMLFWNYFGYKHGVGFNDKGIKMMWGSSDKNALDSNHDALETFFSGDGALVRDSIKASVNWETLANTITPSGDKVFYPQLALPEDYKLSMNTAPVKASYLNSTTELNDIYEDNHTNRGKAWSTTKAPIAAKTLDVIATKAGATTSSPAQIPIFRYSTQDHPETPAVKLANNLILKRLNELTPKVKFVNQRSFADWPDMRSYVLENKTSATQLNGFGPDYAGLGSILSQYLKPTMTGGLVGLFSYIYK